VLSHALDRRAFVARALLLAGGAGLSGLLAACSPGSAPTAPPPTAAAKPAGGAAQPTTAPAAPTTGPATGGTTSKVSFRLNFNPNAEHAPYYLGKKKGFYQAAGIDIDILPGTGSATTAKLVGTGDSMFGVAVADAITVGRGQNIPLVSTAVLLQQSPTVLASLQEKGIATPADLAGKKVGVNPQSTVYAFWVAFTKVNNIDRSKITEINTTGSALGPLIAGAFDATGLLLTNEVVTLEQQGKKLNVLNYADYGVKSYGQVLFSSDKFLKDNPDLAKRFTAATLQSWQYTMDHVDEAVDALAEAVPETDKSLEAAKWPPILKLIPNAEQQVKFGQQTPEGWQQTYQTFKNGGLIDTDFDPTTLFRNDFLPA
jgi:NitT/TauT family transport system substrate-binding protein